MAKEKKITLASGKPVTMQLSYDEQVTLYSVLEERLVDMQSEFGIASAPKKPEYKKVNALYKEMKKVLGR